MTEGISLSIERGARRVPARRVAGLPSILLALGSCVLELDLGGEVHRLDRSNVALVPSGVAHRVGAISPTVDLLTLGLGEASRGRARREYRPHVDERTFAEILARPLVFARTRWFDEITQRYLFERDVCRKPASQAARFLETEIAKEVYFLGKERLAERTRASVVHTPTTLAEAGRAYIEAHLFEPLKVSAIARACHASESTLLRAFRDELGVTPAAYQRQRRLDEALLLLESGGLTASEVATRVGYGDLPAFTVAFQRRFGVPPSAARAEALASRRDRLPPHGEPPVTGSHKRLTVARKAPTGARAKRRA